MGEIKIKEPDGAPSIEKLLEKIAKQLEPLSEKRRDGYITIEDASSFLGEMPVSTIRWKVREGEIRAYKVGRDMVFDPKELREYVKRHPVKK